MEKQATKRLKKISTFFVTETSQITTDRPLTGVGDSSLITTDGPLTGVGDSSQITTDGPLTKECCENIVRSLCNDIRDISNVTPGSKHQFSAFLRQDITVPGDIKKDDNNCSFPYRLLTKTLTNGDTCPRDWLCWSTQKEALFCAPCFLFTKSQNANVSKFAKTGWSRVKGWRKLKDKIPQHESSISHKEHYVAWKLAIATAKKEATIESLLFKEISFEKLRWKQLLERIIRVILFLAERGLALLGDNQSIGDKSNGNFLGLVELLAQYDVLLRDHVEKVKNAQREHSRLQVHYLSPNIQKEFIDLCAGQVMSKIIGDIQKAKYFSIILDATPDSSHKEQTTVLIRFVKCSGTEYSIEERFLKFDNFTKKTGKEIAQRILDILKEQSLDFEYCVGQAYDNGSNMAGKYNGVQAILLAQNKSCLFSSCGNHTLNLVGVNAAECCKEAVTYFGTIQQMYNLFSSSPQRWEILEQHMPVSLSSVSKTRWSARIDSVKPVARHSRSILNALEDLESLNLTAQARTERTSIMTFMSKFECTILSAIWIKVLTMIHQTNLVIEKRDSTLDVERDSVEMLVRNIQTVRESWESLLSEARSVAEATGITAEFATSRQVPTQSEAATNFRVSVFYTIIDEVLGGLKRRFQSLHNLCNVFSFLWEFRGLDTDDCIARCQQFCSVYPKQVSQDDLVDELEFMKMTYGTNFKHVRDPQPKVLLEDILKLNLSSVFPNFVIAQRIFLSIPATVASAERSFSVLKRVKNYHRSTMKQDRLNGLAMLNINHDVAREMDFSSVIEAFSDLKSRKAPLK